MAARRAIGWIGLGVIGLPMAARLVEGGWDVWGYDTDPARCAAASELGIAIAANPADGAGRSDRLVACVVRSADQVDEALFGPAGALREFPDRRAIVMSSVGVIAMNELAATAAELGSGILDGPILGNRAGAETGQLTMLLSGPEDVRADAKAPLSAFSRAVVDFGERLGAAQVVKMISQQQQIVGMVATLEALTLAEGYEVDTETVIDVLAQTSPTWTTDNWEYARDLWERRDPASSLGVFGKDLEAAIGDAAQVEIDLPLAAQALRALRARYGPA